MIDSLMEFADACRPDGRDLEGPPPAPKADPQPPQHLERRLHPTFELLVAPRPLEGLCSGVFPRARLETEHGLVVASDGAVLGPSAWDPEQLRRSRVFERQPRSRRRLVGTHASIVSQFVGYFHWLTEALPRIEVLRRLGLGEVPLIVPPGMTPVHHESLELLAIECWVTYEDGLAPDVLVWPRPPGHTRHPPRWACLWLREQLGGGESAPGGARLYVSRREAGRRRVVNEADMVALLRRHAFDVVQPEHLTLREQAELFGRAAVVVGPHGAGNSNVLFSRGATLVEFFEPRYVNGCFYSLSQALGHPYWYILGESEGESDIQVPLDRLERVLDRVLDEANGGARGSASRGEEAWAT